MTGKRLMVVLSVLALVGAACGDDAVGEPAVEQSPVETSQPVAPDPDEGSETTTAVAVSTTAVPTPPTPVASVPAIAALTSGRGDDGSLEIGIWFSSNPFGRDDVRLLVGTDSDGSFPGVGSPVPHIDGWVEVADAGVSVVDGGITIAADATGGLDDWLSWTGPGPVVWVYFLGNVPVRAGTVWVVLEVDGSILTGGIAGAPFGDGCSFHTAGVQLGSVPGDVPDFGTPCRYPLG
ncbi:MAG: hypothetical protein V3S62_01010 [Acidimicrobiia bacterium]